MNLPCPHCSNDVVYDPSLAGQTVACDHCGKPLRIVRPEQLPDEYQQQYREEQEAIKKREAIERQKLEKQRHKEAEAKARERRREAIRQEELKRRLAEEENERSRRAETLANAAKPVAHTASGWTTESYPTLKVIARICYVVGWVLVAVGAVTCIMIPAAAAQSPGNNVPDTAVLGGFIALAASILLAIPFFLAAESIWLAVNVADDIHAGKEMLKRLTKPDQPGQLPPPPPSPP